jgi:hypothetical protein
LNRKTKERLLLVLGIIALTYILEFRLLQLAQVPTVPEEQKPSNSIVIFDANMTEIYWNSLILVGENVTISDPPIHTFPDIP